MHYLSPQRQHPIWTLVWVPAVPLLLQLLATAPEGAVQDSPVLGPLLPQGKPRRSSQFLASAWPTRGCQTFGERTRGWNTSIFELCLSDKLNKSKKKKKDSCNDLSGRGKRRQAHRCFQRRGGRMEEDPLRGTRLKKGSKMEFVQSWKYNKYYWALTYKWSTVYSSFQLVFKRTMKNRMKYGDTSMHAPFSFRVLCFSNWF